MHLFTTAFFKVIPKQEEQEDLMFCLFHFITFLENGFHGFCKASLGVFRVFTFSTTPTNKGILDPAVIIAHPFTCRRELPNFKPKKLLRASKPALWLLNRTSRPHPALNKKMNPKAKSIGVFNVILPPHMVAIHEKIFIPVVIAITIVAAVK
jgi:hypothetical protein